MPYFPQHDHSSFQRYSGHEQPYKLHQRKYGIQTGKIFITNKVYSGYELPSTGGMGTVPFVAGGGMLTVGAALLLAKRKKHEEKGE